MKTTTVTLKFTDFEAVLVLARYGCKNIEFEKQTQKEIETRLNKASQKLFGCDWKDHAEYILEVNGGESKGLRL